MEPLAENRFTITKELFYEGILRVARESYGPFVKKVLLVLAVLWAVLAAVTLIGSGSLSYAVVEFVVVVLIGIWLSVLMPRNKARRAWAALENRCGADLERITRFYPSYLEIDGGGEETTVFYEDVRQILLSKRLLVLTCADRVGVLVARDGFVSGDTAGVQALIEREMGNPSDNMIEE